ncbi:MAG: DNA topoisomerase IV subunit B [Flavobacteriaceae bacterium]|nr:DNA topoisomerase IV subunit B [Flavobacteriaceae bacterium]
MNIAPIRYTEEEIKSLNWHQHIRKRPGMYIGKLGNGSSQDDGIYMLLKEVLDNCIDEFVMGAGNRIDIQLLDDSVKVRDYGRGIPLGKLSDVVSKMNTGGKYDTVAFKKSVGLNGVGLKAVNALSAHFQVESIRDNLTKAVHFQQGAKLEESNPKNTDQPWGTLVHFKPDQTVFEDYRFRYEFVEEMVKSYTYLNPGLSIYINNKRYHSKNGLKDLLEDRYSENQLLYPIIHLKDDDIEIALTHSKSNYSEEYHSFVNGQNTLLGGTHLSAFKESVVRTIRDFYGKSYDSSDIRKSIIAAVSIKVIEPVFESQTKTKLGSTEMGGKLPSVRVFIGDFLKQQLDNYLHVNSEVAEKLLNKILIAEKERKELSGIRKLARERAKKASLHNKKLRDCRIHLTDNKSDRNTESTIFITEGDSASGSLTKCRDVDTQAVFSLRGKPLNSYGMSKRIVYENEEFNLLQSALNIENGIEYLRYNKIVIATDADVDGMHIRLLVLTFFLQFFPELISNGHLYILETPLFRVRNKNKTIYCYNDAEKKKAMTSFKGNPEITRFKGLGEISPDEFAHFIGKKIRLDQVHLGKDTTIDELLSFYMGKNSPQRQEFIIDNLKVELDLVHS